MHGITLLLVAAIGVDVGWKPDENGELEYIIQIAPEQIQSLKQGDTIEVGVRPMLRSVRRYRIIVGTDPLPRETARPALKSPPATSEATGRNPAVSGHASGNRADAELLTLPAPPPSSLAPALAPQASPGEAKPVDHSVMVRPTDGHALSHPEDPRWVAANGEHEAIQLQPIPTQSISPSVQSPAAATRPPDTLPPPPETPIATSTHSGQVKMPDKQAARDPFVPNYRKQESASADGATPDGYGIGDSVPLNQNSIQASGVVPPTPSLMLPPPPQSEEPLPVTSTTPTAPLRFPPPQAQPPVTKEPTDLLRTATAPRRSQTLAAAGHAEGGPHTEAAPRSNIPEGTTGKQTTSTDGSAWVVWIALALFASIGGNLFLGYVAWDIRKRFLAAFRGEQPADRSHSASEMIVEARDDCAGTNN